VPDGYTRFRGAGVSFVHPQGWRVTERESADGAPSVQVTAPDETDIPGPLIQLIVGSEAGDRFDSLLDQERIVIEEVNDGKIQSQEEVEIEGATRAAQRGDLDARQVVGGVFEGVGRGGRPWS
jgi:hypothetical protein